MKNNCNTIFNVVAGGSPHRSSVNYKKIFLSLFLVSYLEGALGAAKVMQFSADSMQCHKEHMNAICNYVGNAEIVQGQDKLTAPKITTYQNDKHEIYQVIAEGNPANYHTEDATRIMNATAQVIKLYPLKNFAVFIGNAEVIDGKTKCDGEYLEYDMVKKTMISHPHKTNLTKILIQS